jgi:hypothetical protein
MKENMKTCFLYVCRKEKRHPTRLREKDIMKSIKKETSDAGKEDSPNPIPRVPHTQSNVIKEEKYDHDKHPPVMFRGRPIDMNAKVTSHHAGFDPSIPDDLS